ncbi:TolC family protein [Spirosoma arcticum]
MTHLLARRQLILWGFFSLSACAALPGLAQKPQPKSSSPVNVGALVSDTAFFDLNKDITEQLVPFETIYQAALQYSPALHVQNAVATGKLEAYRYSKVLVLDNIYPFVNYAQGNQTLIATGTNPSDALQLSNGTRWGFNVQVPLSAILGRRNLTQQAKADYQVTLAQKDVIALSLKRELIVIYQNLVVSQRIMLARSRDEQVALTAYQVVEVELQQGKADPSQFALVSNSYALSKTFAERARGDFMINFYDLEALVGVPLQSLMIK